MKKKLDNRFEIFPSLGILIFVGLYLYASTLYPGGSQANLNSIGFDWIHNYWCNLMSENGLNGQINPARPFAIGAMIILCISIALFFIQFSKKTKAGLFWKVTIKIGGVFSMIFASFIFTKYHDLMLIVSSVFGTFVVVGIVLELYKSNLSLFKIGGVISVLLLLVNNYIYYSKQGVCYLPLLQKISFVFVLLWVVLLNYKLTKLKFIK